MTELVGSSLASPCCRPYLTVSSPAWALQTQTPGVSDTHMLVMALSGDAGTRGDEGGGTVGPLHRTQREEDV